jgi:JAB domain-containing protein similar to deubiquitination enzymes
MFFKSKKLGFSISIARGALEAIFDECDRYDADETGGRLLGTYRHEDGRYHIELKAVLEPGPNAQRSPTFFLQDGEHQERLFRAIEASHPDIEHLGNWHTHHVNGLATLSNGDRTTYFKTVNHEKHNTDFFYALLVVSKNRRGDPRYTIKHFIFRRGDDAVYEVPSADVHVVDTPVLRARSAEQAPADNRPAQDGRPEAAHAQERAKDQEFFAEFHPDLKPFLSKNSGAPYWKGPLPLIDGSRIEIVAAETADGTSPAYSVASSSKNPLFTEILARYYERQFRSARHAVLDLRRELDEALYREKRG